MINRPYVEMRRNAAAPLDGARVLPLARDAPGATNLVGEPQPCTTGKGETPGRGKRQLQRAQSGLLSVCGACSGRG